NHTTDIKTSAASEVVKATAAGNPIDNTALPLRFAGEENQYFAILIEPFPPPTGQQDRWDAKMTALVLHKDDKAPQKADIGFRINSKPLPVGPKQPVVHTYRIFAGPKTAEALIPYGAEELALYRKNSWIPLAPTLAHYVITPTLAMTYK